MKHNKYLYTEILLISILWLLLFSLPLLFSKFDFDDQMFINLCREYGVIFIVFLLNRFVLMPFLFYRKKVVIYFVTITTLILTLTLFSYFQQGERPTRNKTAQSELPVDAFRRPPPDAHIKPPRKMNPDRPPREPVSGKNNPHPRPLPPFADVLILSFLIIGFDIGLSISMRWYADENKRQQLLREHSEAKLTLLRNQISPHFFMNMLNNVHALIDIDTVKAQESVIRLSKLMSHLLYECEKSKVKFLHEIEFIENYIGLMRVRYSDHVMISVNIDRESLSDVEIPPMLFLNFIENAFKYGVSYKKPSFIELELKKVDDKLFFKLINSNHADPSTQLAGLGIQNINARLDLLYGNDYSLDIRNEDKTYNVNLILKI